MSDNVGFDVNPRGTQLFVVEVVFLILAWIVSSLRAYVKAILVKHISLDDWLMLVALLAYTAYEAIAIEGIVDGGTGKHTSELSPVGIVYALRAWYLCEVIYVPTAALIRTSIGVFLLRLVVQKWQRHLIYATLGMIWLVSIVYFFLMLFQCYPPSHFWEQFEGKQGSCINENVVPIATYVHSSISGICDFIIALLPIAMLWNVQINRRTKIGISILLSMGFFAGIALFIRIPFVRYAAISPDFLFETIDIAIWSGVEPSLGIMAGNVATLRPLVRTFGFGLSSSKSSRRQGNDSKGAPSMSRHWRPSRPSRASRALQTIEDHPSKSSKGMHILDSMDRGSDSSEIELNASLQTPAKSAVAFSHWDVEAGNSPDGEEVFPAGINVHKSIKVTTSHIDDSHI